VLISRDSFDGTRGAYTCIDAGLFRTPVRGVRGIHGIRAIHGIATGMNISFSFLFRNLRMAEHVLPLGLIADIAPQPEEGVMKMKDLAAVLKRRMSSRIPEDQTGLKLLDATVTGAKAQDLETALHRLVIGQEEAVHEIVRTYQTYLAGLAPDHRPIGNFLFLGPTGTGKTRAVEATAEALLGDPRAVIKIDCGEFQHSHEIAKLIGSPPGYLGHR
jgi:transcriptional regulator with AAA-type ATPase domain